VPKSKRISRGPDLENGTLGWLVAAATLIFGWILWPFSGAIIWATLLAVMFAPLFDRFLRAMPRWRNSAALLTLLVVIVMVILPLTIIVDLLVREAAAFYQSYQSGELTFGLDLQRIREYFPAWLRTLPERLGLSNLGVLRERLSAAAVEGGQFLAGQAINIGQRTVDFIVSFFVMLYLLFFLLRDGGELSARIRNAMPLPSDQKQALFDRFTVAVQAIVKGTIVVALAQGALGGLIFWFLGVRAPVLWGALMAVLSLLPVLGTALVWAPVAVYLLMTGALWQGLLLIAYGVLVIGLVDNLLRPILIGQETEIPDYVVLVSTLGGIATFGANGLVIGPVIAAMFLAVWAVFSASRQTSPDDRVSR
jgi:predicted PurR-regulated permease PerM